uniref:ATP synthase protein 8 n=1 Tax=Starmerella bacillaris TaxID=1247836 RepID=Q6ED57_STABA|nr:ATP synthase F0 subunit 8 [Starmerella bacillaris]AAR10339.2 ATP synthase F0 subunit 8 [Starmerella bacillaris]
MPQLVPFFFLNQMFWGYLIILIMIILSSKFVLPRVLSIYLSRMFMLKLKK